MPMPQPTNFTTHIYRLPHLMDMTYLEIRKEIIGEMGIKIGDRLICEVNSKVSWQCGMVALGNGDAYVSINTKRMKQLKLQVGDQVNVTLSMDESEFGMDVPEELQELLAQDEEGNNRFRQLTISKQRYIIYYVSQVKSSQLRIDRAILLIENLKKLPLGKESFREMLGKN